MGAATGMLMQGSNLGQFVGPSLVAAAVAAAGGSWTGALVPLIGGAVLTMAAGLLAGHVRVAAIEMRSDFVANNKMAPWKRHQ
jgi:MFS transporter, DHA1 family, inner membrane transport protein